MDSAEANRMRWAFQRGHYEVWYATLSHLASRTGFWIRYTLEAPEEGHGEPYAQLWFARLSTNVCSAVKHRRSASHRRCASRAHGRVRKSVCLGK